MSLTKKAKTLNKSQQLALVKYLETTRHSKRNIVIFNLSFKAGLRSKGKSGGREIFLNKELKKSLVDLFEIQKDKRNFDLGDRIIQSQRSKIVSSFVIGNTMKTWFKEMGLIGCSSHSGRRTAITELARKVTSVGGSLKDVQQFAGHSSLVITQQYIDINETASRKMVDLL